MYHSSTAVAESEKHRKLTCLLHIFMKETSKVTPFTVVSWKKACECAERWKDLEDCIEKQISVEHADMWFPAPSISVSVLSRQGKGVSSAKLTAVFNLLLISYDMPS